jgi:2-methylcitrate dehydratase PrpD
MNNIREKAPVLYNFVDLLLSKEIRDNNLLHQAKRVTADTFATAFGGVKLPAFKYAFELKEVMFRKGPFEVWGTGEKLDLPGAIFYNALAISSTDYDEGHRKAVGHPASTVVPVALILGEYLNRSFDDVLKSVIIGYEAGTRFSHARKPEHVNSYSTGRWGALASAATAAYLLKLDHEKFMHALSLAFITSPAMQGGSTDVSTGSMAKEGVAWAVQSGLQSALLASKGFVAPYLFIDAYDETDKEKLLSDRDAPWLITTNYFKPFACCRWLHTAVWQAIKVLKKNALHYDMIKKVEVKVFSRIFDLIGNKYPENIVQAQFHMPYVIACALLFGEVSPDQMTEENLKDQKIKGLIDKITMMEEPRFNELFPGQLASGVKIVLENGREFYAEDTSAPWDAGRHPSDEELYQKFTSLTGDRAEKLWKRFFG